MSKTRIYAVTKKYCTSPPNAVGTTRLVRASQVGPALMFVAKDEFIIDVASQDDLIAAIKAGVEVEDVNPPAAPDGQVDIETGDGVKPVAVTDPSL